MIRIVEDGSIAACERYIWQLSAGPSALLLSEGLSYAACGGSAAVAQVVCTWARLAPDHPIVIHLPPRQTYTDFARRPFGLIAILMAGLIRGSEEQDIRREAYEAAKRIVSAMDAYEYAATMKGPGAFLLCADETSLAYLSPFYDRGKIRDEREFARLAEDILTTSVNDAREADVLRYAADVGVMLRELIDNTHRYARQDAEGRRYRKSVRGLQTQTHLVRPADVERLAGGYAPLSRYLQGITEGFGSRQLQLLEVSVLDSGPGLAAHASGAALGDAVTIAAEQDLVQSRFWDTRHQYGRDGAGKGLRRTMRRLKAENGFLRLRTGRTSLFKDFAGAAASPLEPSDLILQDAETGSSAATAMARVEGTLLTMLIPLRKTRA